MKIEVKVIPRAKANKIEEVSPTKLKIRLTSPPVDGKANDQVVELLAKYYNVSKSQIEIVKGLTSRNKLINIL